MTFIQWLNPMTWSTSQVANIISFFGSVGTIGALLYAYYLERKNSKKINDLAIIASELKEQNDLMKQQMKLDYKPYFIVSQLSGDGREKRIELVLTNKGKEARVTHIEYDEKQVVFEKDKLLAVRVGTERKLVFIGRTNGEKPYNESIYSIRLHMTDMLGNNYGCIIVGQGVIKADVLSGEESNAPHERVVG